ncbi:MAG: hypothetical protein Q7P63_13140 [Verrucomicrobiota bacterium JB022]|nr:hypothetical protein [Verrucomicrobiota bacterium JB022]
MGSFPGSGLEVGVRFLIKSLNLNKRHVLMFALTTCAATLLTLAGGLVLYLCSPNQALLAAGLGRGGLWLGIASLLLAVGLFLSAMGPAAAVSSWLVILMLEGSALPFIAFLRRTS